MEGTFIKNILLFYDEISVFILKYIFSQMDSFMWMENYSESKCMSKSCTMSLRDKSCDTQDLEYFSNSIVCRRPLHLEGHSGNFLCKIKSKTKIYTKINILIS